MISRGSIYRFFAVAAVAMIAGAGFADGTIKDECGIAADTFKTWRETSLARRSSWYAKAEKTVPKLYSREVKPVGLVKVQPDAAAFQGWCALPAGEIDLGDGRVLVHPAISIRPDDRIALVGANGIGKSTLVRKIVEHANVPPERLLVVPQEIGEEESRAIHADVKRLDRGPLGAAGVNCYGKKEHVSDCGQWFA